MKKQNIEVEGGELLLQSKEGHYAIIPAKHRQEVMDMVKDGCDDCINNYIQTLPKDSDYAEDGTIIDGDDANNNEVKINKFQLNNSNQSILKRTPKKYNFEKHKYTKDVVKEAKKEGIDLKEDFLLSTRKPVYRSDYEKYEVFEEDHQMEKIERSSKYGDIPFTKWNRPSLIEGREDNYKGTEYATSNSDMYAFKNPDIKEAIKEQYETTIPINRKYISDDLLFTKGPRGLKVERLEYNALNPYMSHIDGYYNSDTFVERLAAENLFSDPKNTYDKERFINDDKYREELTRNWIESDPNAKEIIKSRRNEITKDYDVQFNSDPLFEKTGKLRAAYIIDTRGGGELTEGFQEDASTIFVSEVILNKSIPKEERAETLFNHMIGTSHDPRNLSWADKEDIEYLNRRDEAFKKYAIETIDKYDSMNITQQDAFSHEFAHLLNGQSKKPEEYSKSFKGDIIINNLIKDNPYDTPINFTNNKEVEDQKYHKYSTNEARSDIHAVRDYLKTNHNYNYESDVYTEEVHNKLMNDKEKRNSMIINRMIERFGTDYSTWSQLFNLIANNSENTSNNFA